MLEQAALEEQAEREAADKRHKDLTQLQKEQAALLEERRQQRKLEFAEKEEERRREEMRQQAEDQAIAEERRRILEQHAPLLIGFMPPGVFRDMAEIRSLPENVQAQFRRHVRIQDDPDLWWCWTSLNYIPLKIDLFLDFFRFSIILVWFQFKLLFELEQLPWMSQASSFL